MPFLNTLLLDNPLLRLATSKPSPFSNFCQGLVQERLRAEKSQPTSDTKSHTDLLGHFIAVQKRFPDVVNDAQVLIYSATNVAAGALSTSRVLDR